MDQVKTYLALLVKYHFWVLTVAAALTGMTGWLIATNALQAAYNAQVAKIDGAFAKVTAVTGTADHPNKSFEEGVDKLLNAPGAGLKSRVLAAWKLAYDEQRDKVLIWPAAMQNDFLREIQAIGRTDEIPIEYRERYQNYVKNEFPQLLKIVDAAPYNESRPRRGASGAGPRTGAASTDSEDEEPPHDYIVFWHDQQSVDASLDWDQTPNSKEMRYVQENLWVYEALLQIIARVNVNATGHYNATIKEILALQIGRPAADAFKAGFAANKRLVPPQLVGEAAAAPAAAGGDAAKAAAAPATRGRVSAAQEAVQEEGRYVDAKGQPVAAGGEAPAEFKRMPVFMQFLMDQREISRLLAECANSPLPVEVKMVRINPSSLRTSAVSLFANDPTGGAGAGAGGGGGQRQRPANVNRGAGGGAQNDADHELNPYHVPVEVLGMIYIYNPPDLTKLDVVEAPTEGAAVEGAPVEGAQGEGAPAEGAAPAPTAPAGEPAGEKPPEAPAADKAAGAPAAPEAPPPPTGAAPPAAP